MTAQVCDGLLVDGYQRRIQGEPLLSWLSRSRNKALRFQRRTTACRRGYVATWEAFNGRLFLVTIDAHQRDGAPVRVGDLFTNYSTEYLESVMAHHPSNAGPGQFAFWVSGRLACPMGRQLYYEHTGYGSVYEKTLLLHVAKGFITGQQIIDNAPPPGRQVGNDWASDLELELDVSCDKLP